MVATFAVIKLILPLPEAAKPMFVFEFVQFKILVFDVAKRLIVNILPPHKAVSAVDKTLGVGFTIIVKLMGVPAQPLAVGVTVIFAVWVVDTEGVAATTILPEPLVAMPTAVLSEVQLNTVPDVLLLNGMFNGAPAQTSTFATEDIIGAGLTMITKVSR